MADGFTLGRRHGCGDSEGRGSALVESAIPERLGAMRPWSTTIAGSSRSKSNALPPSSSARLAFTLTQSSPRRVSVTMAVQSAVSWRGARQRARHDVQAQVPMATLDHRDARHQAVQAVGPAGVAGNPVKPCRRPLPCLGGRMHVGARPSPGCPTTKPVQLVNRRPGLALTGGEGLSQVVPLEVLDAGALELKSPGLRVHLADGRNRVVPP